MTDVAVIVGAGPVGLVLALALSSEGVPVVLLEANGPDVPAQWRGSTLHPPTLELLDRIGIAAAAVAGGVRVDRLQYRDVELDQVAEFDYSLLVGRTPFPFRLQYEQYKMLRQLREFAAADPLIDLRYNNKVHAVEQDTDAVRIDIDVAAGGRQSLSAGWLIGADGARSVVRQAAGIDFPGTTHPTMSLVAATSFPLEGSVNDLAPVSYWTGPRGRVSLIRTPDTWRVAVSTPIPADDDGPEPPRPYPTLVDGLDQVVGDHSWADTPLAQHQFYRSHQRVAEQFDRGRVVLMGDAAHLSSTTGGMGLNSGIHDAFDLAQVLAPHLRAGGAGGDVAVRHAVHRYGARRREIANRIVQPATKSARSGVDLTDIDERAARLDALRRTAADPDAALRYLQEASMFDSWPSGAGS